MISSPIKLYSKRGKVTSLNLNKVKKLHFLTYNKLKIQYSNHMSSLVQKLPIYTKPIEITYILYVPNKIKSDLMNYVAIIDKFFQDVLVKEGKIPDDNYTIVPRVTCKYGGVDKNNPRMEIEINEI